MKLVGDYKISYEGESMQITTGFGSVNLDFGRIVTIEDAGAIQRLMNLGARIYADEVRQAQLKVNNLVNWGRVQ